MRDIATVRKYHRHRHFVKMKRDLMALKLSIRFEHDRELYSSLLQMTGFRLSPKETTNREKVAFHRFLEQLFSNQISFTME